MNSAFPETISEDQVPEPLRAPFRVYRERLLSLRRSLSVLDQRGAWLAHGRSVGFFGAAFFLGARVMGYFGPWGYGAAAVLFAGFLILAFIHGQVLEAQAKESIRIELNERGIDRLTGRWRQFQRTGAAYANPLHPYVPDLDVFGTGSLFQLIDETATSAGEAVLANYLSQAPAADDIRARQEAVRELTGRLSFRQEVVVESRRATTGKPNPARFIEWAEGPDLLRRIRWAAPLPYVLPPLAGVLYVLHRYELLASWPYLVCLGLQILCVGLTRKTIARMYEQLSAGEQGFIRFGPAFLAVESERFEAPLLKHLTHPLTASGQEGQVSAHLNAFSRWMDLAEQRKSQLHPVMNGLLLWDLFFFFRLEVWRKQHGPNVRSWFEALAQIEALISLGGLAHDRPQFTFPKLLEGDPQFVARSLGHPLLKEPVTNSVSLQGPSFALLITGSNMSGKTTLLRAVGTNTVLALAGAPVCAESMELTVLQVLTSMRVQDSLELGLSLFYAEVKRLKSVLDAAGASKGQALFLLDEILLGTNTRERQIASRIVLKQLLATGSIGAVSTHDLSLAELEEATKGRVHNVHFSDHVEAGLMRFDYRLREGVVATTNALRVMALAGFHVDASEG